MLFEKIQKVEYLSVVNISKKNVGTVTLLVELHTDFEGFQYILLRSSNLYYVYSPSLLASHYDSLMNRGFRRSGRFIYKPVMHKVVGFDMNKICKVISNVDMLSSIYNTTEGRQILSV